MPLTIASVSDIHGQWAEIEYPPADVLVFAGDILSCKNFAYYSKIECAHTQLEELERFNEHLRNLKKAGTYKEIIVVAGNHDFVFERLNKEAREKMADAIYLQDESCVVDGVKFHGSPWQRWFWDWAFNLPNHNENFARYRAHARRIHGLIEDDTNVLITHGPPCGILDITRGENVGDPFLTKRLDELKNLKAHFFGHIHVSYGRYTDPNGRQYINTAICNERYDPVNPIPVITI